MSNWTKKSAEAFLKKTIGELAGKRALLRGDYYGLELENELDHDKMLSAQDLHAIQAYGFKVTKDGSLRGNAFEFISSPSTKDALKNAVGNIQPYVRKYEWSNSRRTSTHVHVNFQDKTLSDLIRFVALYWMFEPALFTTVSLSRVDNTFCIPSVYTRDQLIHAIYSGILLEKFANEDIYKYASLNLHPLLKLGTVECRIFHGTFDPPVINKWLDFLDALKVASTRYKCLAEVKKDFLNKSINDFGIDILGRNLYMDLKKSCDIDNLIREGYRKTQPVLTLDKSFESAESFLTDLALEEQKQFERVLELLGRDVDVLQVLHGLTHVESAKVPRRADVVPAPVFRARVNIGAPILARAEMQNRPFIQVEQDVLPEEQEGDLEDAFEDFLRLNDINDEDAA